MKTAQFYNIMDEKSNKNYVDSILLFLGTGDGLPLHYISPNVVDLTGYTDQEFLKDRSLWMRNVHPDDKEAVRSHWKRLQSHGSATFQYRFLHKDGHYVHIQDDLRIVTSPIDSRTEIIGCAIGIKFGAARSQLIAFNKILTDGVSSAIYVADTMGYIEWSNANFRRHFGYSGAGENAMRLHMRMFDLGDDAFAVGQWRRLLEGKAWTGKSNKISEAGKVVAVSESIFPIVNDNGVPFRFVGVLDPEPANPPAPGLHLPECSDIDPITGLLDGHGFRAAATKLLHTAAPTGAGCLCGIVSMSNFEDVESVMEWQSLPELLSLAAARMRNAFGSHYILCRLEGGSFGFFGLTMAKNFTFVESLREHFSTPFTIRGQDYRLQPRIGLARGPAGSVHVHDLLSRAKIALRKVHTQPENGFAEYAEADLAAWRRRFLLLQSLGSAVEQNQLYLEYQPIVDARTLAVTSVETLVRWRHPDFGIVSPGDFIPIAERTGDIVGIGAWVLESACAQRVLWNGDFNGTIAVNVSVAQLRRAHFVEDVVTITEKHGLEAAKLEFEVTESLLVEEDGVSLKTLLDLHERGYRLALDDFGRGNSNLEYLNLIPIEKIKVDRFFIQRAQQDERSEKILRGLVSLATDLECCVLGEGVEDEETLSYLRGLGFDEIQGFFTGRPMTPEAFLATARNGPCVKAANWRSDAAPVSEN